MLWLGIPFFWGRCRSLKITMRKSPRASGEVTLFPFQCMRFFPLESRHAACAAPLAAVAGTGTGGCWVISAPPGAELH